MSWTHTRAHRLEQDDFKAQHAVGQLLVKRSLWLDIETYGVRQRPNRMKTKTRAVISMALVDHNHILNAHIMRNRVYSTI